MTRGKWRNLHACLRNPSQALPVSVPSKKWEHFRDAMYNAAMNTFGKNTSKPADWFVAHSDVISHRVEAERLGSLTKPAPANANCKSSGWPGVKSSRMPGVAPMTTGFSSAPRFSWQQTRATSRGCMVKSSRPWAQHRRKLPRNPLPVLERSLRCHRI